VVNGETVFQVYSSDLVNKRVIVPKPEPPTSKILMDYSWAKQLGLIRKPANFISTISDDRGDELIIC
jgi:ATP citrate (pro-S)-lyase